MRTIKILGLVAAAAMAVVAVAVPALASADNFTAGQKGKSLKETSIKGHVFNVTGSDVVCKSATFTGATEGTHITQQSVEPKYEECTAFGFAGATVNTAGCKYTFNAETDEAGMATVDLVGCTGGGITITVNIPFIAKCVVLVKNQSIGSAVSYKAGASEDLVVTITASTIHDEVTTSTNACPLTVGTHANATYTGESTVQGEGTPVGYDLM